MPIHFIEMKARLLELLGRRNGLRPSEPGASHIKALYYIVDQRMTNDTRQPNRNNRRRT
jgi:hypothetical protein